MSATNDLSPSRQQLKSQLRSEALARRDALEIDDRLDWDKAIAEAALSLDVWGEGPVSAYWPMRSEADPRPILEGLNGRGVPMALPAVVDGALVFRAWRPWEPLMPGGFGTLVPPPDAAVVRPAVLIVPLAAFDRRGYRIGYGKGYYDRALAELGPVRTVGIAYTVQEIAAVPEEDHDVALDVIVTEDGVVRPGDARA